MDFYFPILLDLQLAVCLGDDIGSICQSSSCNISTWAVTAWLTSYIVRKQQTNTRTTRRLGKERVQKKKKKKGIFPIVGRPHLLKRGNKYFFLFDIWVLKRVLII